MTPLRAATGRVPGTTARLACLTGSTAFAAAALLHTAWGLGAAWPMRTRSELADAVVGNATMAGPLPCFAGGGLAAAVVLTAAVGYRGRD